MNDETSSSADHPQETKAQPVTIRKVFAIPVRASYVAYVVVVALAVVFGYAYKASRPPKTEIVYRFYREDVPTPMTSQPSFTPPEPVPDPVPETPVRTVLNDAVTLKIDWQKSYEIPFDFLEKDTVHKEEYGNIKYYVVGRVTNDGPYKDDMVVIASVPCDGLCGGPDFYRFLFKNGDSNAKPYLLQHDSPESLGYLNSVKSDFTILANARIPEFEFPKTLKGPKGQTLPLTGWDNSTWFSASNRRFSFRDAVLGDVFADENGGFYVLAADGTQVLYEVPVPFVKDTSIPEVTWVDGARNTYDYTYRDYGGCGSSNILSIIDGVNASRDLVVGGEASNGDPVYFFRDRNHPILKGIFESGYGLSGNDGKQMGYEEFIAAKPVFVWKDPFDRLIKFQRSSFQLQAECGKPVIYLYPEETTKVSVRVEPKGGLTKSDPPYEEGWNVIAQPDGALTNLEDGKTYPYLFWEGRGGLYETPKQGYVIAREEVPAFVENQLRAHGLNAKEIADFTEFWLPRMIAKPYYFVTFLTTRAMDRLAPLTVEPKPETVFRILMDYLPLEAPIEVTPPSAPRPLTRRGFTVIEWGGVLGRE